MSLESKGIEVDVFHAISFSVATKIRDFFSGPKEKNKPRKARTSASVFSIFLRKIFILIDIIRFNLYAKRIAQKQNRAIITDRYFFDQIVNIFYLENKSDISYVPAWLQIAEMMIRRPERAFYIKTSPHIAIEREREIEQGVEYLERKSLLYDLFSDRFHYTVIDGDLQKEEVAQEILNLI